MLKTVLAMVLSLTSVVLMAAGELDIARQALRDGLWEIARLHAGTNASEEARLVVLESYAGEGKWETIGKTLEAWPDAKGVGFDYYRAVVRRDHAAALAALKKTGAPEGLVEAKLHEAESLARDGNRTGAEVLWRDLLAMTNVSERVLAHASANLMDAEALRRAYAEVGSVSLRRMVGLRLGVALLREKKTAAEGERLIREIVRDSPDADGAREAFLDLADSKLSDGDWKDASDAYREAVEIWPDAARVAAVQEGRGWALQKQGRLEDALEAFRQAGAFAVDDAAKATALLKEGDVLSELGRIEAAMEKYREVSEKYPKTTVAEKLKAVLRIREREAEGRRLYREFRYGDAMAAFARVAEADSSRRPRMSYFSMLCLYGQGYDEEALAKARDIVATCPDPAVRVDALMWLAKFQYNRRDWKESGRLFVAYAESDVPSDAAAEALLWASRAALADNDFNGAIQLSTRLVDRYPNAPARANALLVQGEALVELARFDEAVLVFDRVAVLEGAQPEIHVRARLLKADALYAMGADNPVRYEEALEAYRAVSFGGSLSASGKIVVAFKIARCLDRLKRIDEAIDQYYSQVVIVYRENRLRGVRLDDEARASFSRAAFRLAEEYEGRGRDRQALHVLTLVAESDVPASEEAKKRMDKISNRGRFL